MEKITGKIINITTNAICYLSENVDDGARYEVKTEDIKDWNERYDDAMLYVGLHEDLKTGDLLNVYIAQGEMFDRWKEIQGMQERIEQLVKEIGEYPTIVIEEEEKVFKSYGHIREYLETSVYFLENYREAQAGRVCCYDSDEYDDNTLAALDNLTKQQEIELNFLCRIEDYHDREEVTKAYLEELGLLK